MSAEQSTVEYRDLEPLGFPGYRVGTDGSVWSCWKSEPLYGRRGFRTTRGPWFRMQATPLAQKTPYLTVTLTGKRRLVHRLVLMAFVGSCPPGMEACHSPDRDPANCRLSNLRWDTRPKNRADSHAHGTSPIGERSKCAKLTERQVRSIVTEVAEARARHGRLPYKFWGYLIARYGIGLSQAKRIANGEAWRHVTAPAAAPTPAC